MIGPKSGAPTVRRIIKIYRQINSLIGSFLEGGGLLIAEDCDVLNSFKCTGGVFDAERRILTPRVSDNMEQVFGLADASSLPITPSHLIDQERELQTIPTFVSPECTGTCSNLSGLNKVKCQKNYLFCKGRSVDGLSFPFMSDLTSVVGLLSGGDIVRFIRNVFTCYFFCCSRKIYTQRLVDFSPPTVTFAFTFELFFVLYTPPTVELTITFEFTAALKVGFVLDSKGVREAVEQEAPFKALNSFALK